MFLRSEVWPVREADYVTRKIQLTFNGLQLKLGCLHPVACINHLQAEIY
jgi:hypothetical protein